MIRDKESLSVQEKRERKTIIIAERTKRKWTRRPRPPDGMVLCIIVHIFCAHFASQYPSFVAPSILVSSAHYCIVVGYNFPAWWVCQLRRRKKASCCRNMSKSIILPGGKTRNYTEIQGYRCDNPFNNWIKNIITSISFCFQVYSPASLQEPSFHDAYIVYFIL